MGGCSTQLILHPNHPPQFSGVPFFADKHVCGPTRSFGDPNAQPPTPSTGYTSPQTPKHQHLQHHQQPANHFVDESSSGWTPRFAEEYSVFNSTPGNFKGPSSGSGTGRSSSAFAVALDFAPLSHEVAQLPPHPSTTAGKKRRLSSVDSTPGLGVSPASHVTSHSAPDSVEQQLATNVGTVAPPKQQYQARAAPPRSVKKSRTASIPGGATILPVAVVKSPTLQRHTQTATPPPSSRGGRKLAPKPQTDSMQQQNQGGGFPQPDFSSAQQQAPPPPQLNTAFVSGHPDDVFGYAMGGPATAPPMTGPRTFWGFDMGSSGIDTSGLAMDVDLSGGGDLFQAPTQVQQPQQQQRPMSSLEWGRTHFQQTTNSAIAQPEQSPHQNVQQNRPNINARTLAPKTASLSTNPNPVDQSPGQSFGFSSSNPSFQMSMSDPFSTSTGGVDPGLLFSQPPSSAPLDSGVMDRSMVSMSMSMDTDLSRPTSSAPPAMAQTSEERRHMEVPATSAAPRSTTSDTRPPGNQVQSQPRQQLAPAISPLKNQTGRPNLSRSFSESARGGKRTVGGGRTSLPALAPARPVTIHQPSLPPTATAQGSKPSGAANTRPSGRNSPLKSSHHHRLSSLSSIPENARSRSARRTSVKFVIDENGRARAETIVDATGNNNDNLTSSVDPDPAPFPSSQRSSSASSHRNSWAGPFSVPAPVRTPDDEYSSSEDDEPIIIPSRTTSFAYPDPPKSSGSGHGTTGTSSRPPTAASSGIFSHHRVPRNPGLANSMDIDDLSIPKRPSTGSSLGDAAAELRKVMQAAHPLRRPASGGGQQAYLPPASSGPSTALRARFTPGQRSSSSTISEASLPGTSPPNLGQHGGAGGQRQLRCVCNRPEAGDGVFMVKWYVSF